MSSVLYSKLGEPPKRTSFTFITELDPLFRDHDALLMYRQYLHQSTQPALAFHIDFFVDMMEVEDSMEDEHMRLEQIYNKYFHHEGECILEVRKDVLEKVREEVEKGKIYTFEPAIKVVVRDLAFSHFNGFWECEEFKHHRETRPGSIPNTRKQREKAHLAKFFGEEIDESDAKRVAFRAQPGHVKRYRLDRIFGEKSAIDYVTDLNGPSMMAQDEEEETEGGSEAVRVRPRRAASTVEWKRCRRLHVFFGDSFPVDEVVYSEKVRSTSVIDEIITRKLRRQPIHVHPHRLNRFFGERVVPNENESVEEGDKQGSGHSTSRGPRYPRTQRIQRFFGERMDPDKEASTVSFADQPPHVKSHRLRRIFGTPPVSNKDTFMEEDVMEVETNNQGRTPEMKRAHKLHRFFGTKVDEGIM